MDWNWEQHYQEWEFAHKTPRPPLSVNALEKKARNILQQHPVPDVDWILSMLEGTREEDTRKRFFLARVLRPADQIPKVLFRPLLRAAVYEKDPGLNKRFLLPCLRSKGHRKVNKELLSYLENGTDAEKGGAASAFFWSLGQHDRVAYEDISDLVARKNYLFLTEFFTNEDLNVRRRILMGLELNPELYPEEIHSLVPKAIQIAREHTDAFIRHRIEVQLGRGGHYMFLPSY